MYPDVMPMRRAIIERVFDLTQISILEIGAFDRPVYTPAQANVRFLDYRDAEELRKVAADEEGRLIDQIPDVHYVATSNFLSKEVDRSFDLVIGNHVVEHIPNLIVWLCEMHAVVKPGGCLFLSVPDRRFTFDYLRRETTAIDVLRWFKDGLVKPCFDQILDFHYNYRPVTGVEGYHPEVLVHRLAAKPHSLPEAIRISLEKMQLPYYDIHCNVFTYDSFVQIMTELAGAGISPFVIEEAYDVVRGTIEFQVLLRSNPAFNLPPEIQGWRQPGLH